MPDGVSYAGSLPRDETDLSFAGKALAGRGFRLSPESSDYTIA